MKKHILLDKAHCYSEPNETAILGNYEFAEHNGYWKNIDTGEIMMLSVDFQRPQTKKEDRETGEDQKGE